MVRDKSRLKIIIIGLILFGICLYSFTSKALPQEANTVYINEVCPKNQSVLRDSQKTYPGGWIELYNAGPEPVSLEGYRLTNVLGRQDKNILPAVELEPGGFRVIYADGGIEYGLSEQDECYLDLKLNQGEQNIYLVNPSGEVVDHVSVPDRMPINTSYGKTEEGGAVYGAMTCTPFVSNAIARPVTVPVLDTPLFSHESGFYKSDFYLTMTAGENQKIYYTLDGSVPQTDDYLYTEPVHITDSSPNDNVYASLTDFSIVPYYIPESPVDKATVVRAAVYDENDNKSEVVTATYFVDGGEGSVCEVYGSGIPVLSIVADPEDLFGDEAGIMVLGDQYREYLEKIRNGEDVFVSKEPRDYNIEANFNGKNRKWEREAAISYFEQGECMFEQSAGIRTRGKASSEGPQKGFTLYAREMYDGNPAFLYDILGNGRSVKKIILKYSKCILRDGFIMDSVSDRAVIPLHYQPVYVFLNGEFWGTYTFLERYDAQFFEDYYGIDEENLVVVKNKEIDIGTEADREEFYGIFDFARENDLSLKENYEEICSRVDIESLIDYYCIRIYIDDVDSTEDYNMLAWKSREENAMNLYEDGKWHWAVYDIDASLYDVTRNNLSEQIREGREAFLEHTLIKALLQNAEFRDKFIRHFLDLMNTDFSSENIVPRFEEAASYIRNALILQHTRFKGPYDDGTVDAELAEMKYFYENREKYVLQYLQEYFGLSDAEMEKFQDQVTG